MSTDMQLHYDSTHSHILSAKALKEGWDTFIFLTELVRPGTLLIGLNTKQYGLKRSDVGRWLSILANGSTSDPPPIHDCEIEAFDVFSYIPINVSDEPISWTQPEAWKPGNYALGVGRLKDSYNAICRWCTIEDQLIIREVENMFSPPIIQPAFKVISNRSDLQTSQIYIFPGADKYCFKENVFGWEAASENMITLPSVLVEELYRNNFGYDIRMKRFIVFPGISPEAESILAGCRLSKEMGADWAYIILHFRWCLRVHCQWGDIGAEFGLDNVWSRCEEWYEDGTPPSDRDLLDVAIRQWEIECGLRRATSIVPSATITTQS